jgi:hypothetical protein
LLLALVGALALANVAAGVANAADPAAAARGNERDVERTIDEGTIDDEPLEGFWPTQRMIDSVVRRWALEAADKYDLRPAQHEEVEARLLERWHGFLQENRRDLQPLINEYLETRLDLEPPDADDVARWAARAMPVFDSLRKTIEAGEVEVREMLTPTQRVEFEKERVKRRLGLQFFESNLKRWSVGSFAQREWWDPPRGYRDDANKRHSTGARSPEKAKGGAATNDAASIDSGGLPQRVALELNAWEIYVQEFCDKYDLDVSQRNAAESMLKEMILRAQDHVLLHRAEMDDVEFKIANPEGVKQQDLDKKLADVYGPMDRMFRELDERLNRLPTRGQRQRAEGVE